ncbi:hypothetical protein EON65_07580 [archaeon]|nr:MAG: hypothetical protein EON65_07580 [archaeon]
MEDWHLTQPTQSKAVQYGDVILAWYIGYYATMYVIMSTGPAKVNWKVIKDLDAVEILDPSLPCQRNGFISLDPRLYLHNRHLYIEHFRQVGKRHYVLYADRLHYNASFDALHVHPPVRQFVVEGELGSRPQKNWAAFEFQPNRHTKSSILYVYSINPHRILHQHCVEHTVNLNMTTVSLTEYVPTPNLPVLWQYGELRGGSPAKVIHTLHGNRYLTFFHSQYLDSNTGMLTYYMGAYLFQAHPPFAMTHITPDIIACKQCYNEEYGIAYKALDYILFPMGFVIRERGQILFVSVGRNDNSAYILKINKTALVDYMVEVETKVLYTTK